MIIQTNKGKINATETPRWNEYHRCFYAAGFKWIESRKDWSKTARVWNFKTYEVGE